MIVCATCDAEKGEGDFYLGSNGKPQSLCKDCHKARMRQHRRSNPDVQDRERRKAQTPEKRAQIRANAQRWRQQNPDAYRAHNAVNNAIRDGKLKKQPCELCGSTERLHAHHRDYAKPLDVNWLCAKCHHRIHALFPELEGRNKAA